MIRPPAVLLLLSTAWAGGACLHAASVQALTGVTVITGTGQTIEEATVLIRGSTIAEVGKGIAVPEGAAVLNLPGACVVPGFVAAYADLVRDGREDDPSLFPEKVAYDGFALFGDWRRQVHSGTTSAYLVCGTQRLVAGQGSVVRLGVSEQELACVRRQAALEAVLTRSSLNPPGVFEPEVYPRPSKPFPHLEKELPTARASQIAELARFLRSSHPQAQAVRQGKLRLRIRADTAEEIEAALKVARQFHLRVVLLGAREAGPLARKIRAARASVVWLCPFRPQQPDRRDPVRRVRNVATLFDTPRALAAAGVPLAVAPEDGQAVDLLPVASFCVCHGLSPQQALASITTEAARVLGAGDQLGVIAPGRVADLVVLNGPPFSQGVQILRTFVAGKVLFDRTPPEKAELSGTLVLRNALVLSGDGGRLPGADILVRGDRIVAVGAGIKPPAKAKVIDLKGKVCAPGMIDLASTLGIHAVGGESEQVPAFVGDETFLLSVATFLRAGDPVYEACVREGVLGLVIRRKSPGRLLSGTGAFVIPGQQPASFVARPFACIDVSVVGSGRLSRLRRLRSLLGQLQKYEAAWKRYREALLQYRHRKPRDTENRLKEPAPPGFDPVMERLIEARKRALPIFVYAERGDEIEGALRVLADEGGYECAVVGASGIQYVENVTRMCRGVVLTPPYRRRVHGTWVDLPLVLARRDVPLALATGGAEGSLYLRYYAAEAVRRGLSPEEALRAVTYTPARLLGVSDRFGVIAAGRVANIVVYDGEVFAPSTQVVMVLAGGKIVYKPK